MSDDYKRGYLDGLYAARDVAVAKAYEREAAAEASLADGRGDDAIVETVQGATVAVISNQITALIQGLELSKDPA